MLRWFKRLFERHSKIIRYPSFDVYCYTDYYHLTRTGPIDGRAREGLRKFLRFKGEVNGVSYSFWTLYLVCAKQLKNLGYVKIYGKIKNATPSPDKARELPQGKTGGGSPLRKLL